jgi:hypothetical protein
MVSETIRGGVNQSLTDTGYGTDGVDILDPGFRFDLKTGDERFVGRFEVCRDVDAVGDGWKC